MADAKVVDPLGREITLHDHTWYGHILVQHPEMRRHRRLVEQAISEAAEVRISDADSNCRLYFGDGPREGIIIAVVADVVAGFVKTAHLVRRPKGAIEWSRQTR